jgi:hypothetical protein
MVVAPATGVGMAGLGVVVVGDFGVVDGFLTAVFPASAMG